MANQDTTSTFISGFEPVTLLTIENMADIPYEQDEALGALFRTAARLSDDRLFTHTR